MAKSLLKENKPWRSLNTEMPLPEIVSRRFGFVFVVFLVLNVVLVVVFFLLVLDRIVVLKMSDRSLKSERV